MFEGSSAQPWESALAEVAKAAAINVHVHNSLSEDTRKYAQSLANGAIYQGPLTARQLHGTGKYVKPNGEMFWGEFQHGSHHGYDVLQLPDMSTHTGRFVSGRSNGAGHIQMADGEEYLGMFKQGH